MASAPILLFDLTVRKVRAKACADADIQPSLTELLMLNFTRPLALVLGLAAFAAPAFAQETAPAAGDGVAPPDGTELSMGQEQSSVVEPYVKGTYGDWKLRCVKAKDGSDPCELYQLLKDPKGNPVSEISMLGLPEGGQAAVGATVIVPLETLLTKQLSLTVDSGKAKVYPFTFCASVGCFARIGFTADEIAAMQKGNKATVSVVPFAAPDQIVSVDISLKGFTDAYNALKAEMPVKKN
jgi:invasion protein IalB